jgi:alkylation response protein AidB-like acyl-CoA dehydrogenase
VLAVFTEEQRILEGVARKFAQDYGLNSPADLKAADRIEGWKALASIGVAGLRLRDASGVPQGTALEIAIAAQALGRRLVPLPLLGAAVLPLELLALCSASEKRLTEVAEGRQRVCVVLSANLSEVATARDEVGYAWDCEGAQLALKVSSDGPGFAVTVHPVAAAKDVGAADLTRTVARVEVGPPIEQYALSVERMDRWLAFALTAITADMVGAMQGALDGVVEYSKMRVQFGVPIGSFQAVQHICSESLVKISGAASTVNYAAWAIDELPVHEALLAARTAKAYAASIGLSVCESVMQVYGGLGQTWESIAHFYSRRVMLSAQVLGDRRQMLEGIASLRLGVN